MSEIKSNHKVVDGVNVVHIEGRLDLPGADAMEIVMQQRLSAGGQRLVLNLAGVGYISSAGLRFLLILVKKIQSVNGILVLCCLSSNVLNIINMSGFNQLLKICETEEQAVAVAASATK